MGYQWTEAQVAKVPIVIGNESFLEKVLPVPGEDLEWTAILKFHCNDPVQWTRVANLLKWKKALPDDHNWYIPPTSKDGHIQGAVLVFDGVQESQEDLFDVIEALAIQAQKCNDTRAIEEDEGSTSEMAGSVEEEGEQVVEKAMGSETGDYSVLGEEVGESLEGSANREGSQEANVQQTKAK